MKSHLMKEKEVVLTYRWQFQDGRSKGMGMEWDKEVLWKVDPPEKSFVPSTSFLEMLNCLC